ncbi:MAG: cell surface protein [Planctomycetaceae bacterium]|nr:cell surface protein [Planctomycetaceae bacterium]
MSLGGIPVSILQRTMVALGLCTLLAGTLRGESGTYLGPIDVVASPDQQILYVLQYDAQRIDVLDVATNQVTRSIACPGAPTGLAVQADGSTLYVTCGVASGVVCAIESSTGNVLQTIAVGHSPCAPALLPDGKHLVVCNRFNNDVSLVDVAAAQQVARVPVLREPVASDVTPDGSLVLVANLLPIDPSDADTVAAEISLIQMADLATTSIRLPNGSSSIRDICVSPDGKYAYAVHVLSRYRMPTTQLERGWMNTNALSVIDVASRTLVNTVLLDEIDLGAANPYAVTTSADGAVIYVSHAGTHELSVVDAPGLMQKLTSVPKTMEEAREQGRLNTAGTYASTTVVDVPNDLTFLVDLRQRVNLRKRGLPGVLPEKQPLINGPRGLEVIGSKIYVAMYFSDALALVDMDSKLYDKVTLVPLGPEPQLTLKRKGEMYFRDADICFQQWQSCNSCHPDIRADGLNWDLLNDDIGTPKNTKSMLLAYETPPSMSAGVRKTAEEATRAGIEHIQFAVPPAEDQVPESIDEFLKALEPVPSPYLVDGKLSESAERGKTLFFSEKVGCSKCHPEPLYTDLKMHDVGSSVPYDRRVDFDTPTLVEVWRTAPYMHDGHYVTIKDLLVTGEHGARAGELDELTEQDIDDLVEFVLSL